MLFLKLALLKTKFVIVLIDIIIVKSDPILNTPTLRDQKIVRSLRKKYSIIGLGWNRRGQGTAMAPSNKGIDIKLFNVKGVSNFESHGTLRYIPYMLVFWMWVFMKSAYTDLKLYIPAIWIVFFHHMSTRYYLEKD